MKNDIHRRLRSKKSLSKHGWITAKKSFKHGWTAFFASAFLTFYCTSALAQCLPQTKLLDLPKQVQTMRQDILSAVKTGEIESLKGVLEQSELWPMAQIGNSNMADVNPINQWVEQSKKTQGAYILAQLDILLNMPYQTITLTQGLDLYIWPYFSEADLSKLCSSDLVNFLKLNTPQAWQEMHQTNKYTGFQIAIGSDGSWHYLVRKNLAKSK